jgi:hypothetical protein
MTRPTSSSAFLPEAFFNPQQETHALLWLPPLEKHSLTQKIDWLSGLSISRGLYLNQKKWCPSLNKIINDEKLSLDETLSFNQDSFLFKLPSGFKCSTGLILKNEPWSDASEVQSKYLEVTKLLKPKSVQSPYIWESAKFESLKEVQWIKV